MVVIDLTLHRRHQSSESISTSLRHTLHALRFRHIPLIPSYYAMNRVYFFTFATANLTEAYSIPTLGAMTLTTAVNITTMAQKDRILASMWRSSSTPTLQTLPLTSRALSTMGAMVTVYAQFVQRKPWEQEIVRLGMNPSLATFVSSASISMAAQLVSTPFHLLSMDLYRYPERTWHQRLLSLTPAYPPVCIGRMLRVLPAFGGGGYLNEQGKRWNFGGLNK